MQVNVEPQADGTAIVNVHGHLNAASADTFERHIAEAISQGHIRLVVHLAHVSSMDSSGLGTLVRALKATRRLSGDFSIMAPSPPVHKLFRLTTMNRVFKIYQAPEDALRPLTLDVD